MEHSPENQELNLGNQKPSPDNHRTKSSKPGSETKNLHQTTMEPSQGNESKQPGTFTRQPWNQGHGTKNQIQQSRNLYWAIRELCPCPGNHEVNSGSQKPSPGNKLIAIPINQETNPSNQEPSPENHGTKPREAESERRKPKTFTRQP